MTKGILSYLTRHRTAANLLVVILLAAGLAAYPKMRAQFFPDVIVDTSPLQFNGAEPVPKMLIARLFKFFSLRCSP